MLSFSFPMHLYFVLRLFLFAGSYIKYSSSSFSFSQSILSLFIIFSLSLLSLCWSAVVHTLDSQPNRILLVTIHHMLYPITVEVLHQVFSPHGIVEKIVTFQKSAGQLLQVFFLSLSLSLLLLLL